MIHSDVGGYTMVDQCLDGVCVKYERRCELLMRWTEMSAFTDAILRTHPGSGPGPGEAQIYSSNASKLHFAAYARVHQALCEYRWDLMQHAETTGIPMARHPMLHYENLESLLTQVMIGEEIMMAPALRPSPDHVISVILPKPPERDSEEFWVRWPSFERVGFGRHQYQNPLGMPAVFLKSGMQRRFPDSWERLKAEGENIMMQVIKNSYTCSES